MTHLPECALSDNTDWTSWTVDCCICDRLRACEQRVLDAAREAVDSVWTIDPSWDGTNSVWTIDPSWDGTNWNNALYEASVAIDALREGNR